MADCNVPLPSTSSDVSLPCPCGCLVLDLVFEFRFLIAQVDVTLVGGYYRLRFRFYKFVQVKR